MSVVKFLMITPLVLILSACGGGGSNGKETKPPTPNPIPVSPTPTPTPTPTPIVGTPPKLPTQIDADFLATTYMSGLKSQNQLVNYFKQALPIYEGGIFKLTTCTANAILTYQDNDHNQRVSDNDVYTITYNNCTQGNEVYVSGTMQATIGTALNLPNFVAATNNGADLYKNNWVLNENILFKDFKTRPLNSNDYQTNNGEINVSLVSNVQEQLFFSSLSSSSLVTTANTGGTASTISYNGLDKGFKYQLSLTDLATRKFTADYEFEATYTLAGNPMVMNYDNLAKLTGILDSVGDPASAPSAGVVSMSLDGYRVVNLTAKETGATIEIIGVTNTFKPWSSFGLH